MLETLNCPLNYTSHHGFGTHPNIAVSRAHSGLYLRGLNCQCGGRVLAACGSLREHPAIHGFIVYTANMISTAMRANNLEPPYDL